MLKLMLPARATRWPIPDRTLPSGNLVTFPARLSPPGPSQVQVRTPSSCSKKMPINLESAKAPRKLRRRGEAYRLVVPISPSKFGTAARFSPRRRLSSKLRPRGVVLDELGSGGPSNEAGLHHREHSS